MNRNLCLLLLLILSTVSYSQTVTLKGKVADNAGIPLESATIYLTSAKDSSVVTYTISGKSGSWELKTHKLVYPVYLKVSFVGLLDYSQLLENVTADQDFGVIKLEDRPTELDAVVIESEIPPIRVKKDTLEFNASSFKVRPDANVEALLKQLPGVEIDEEGKITVNGKEVNQILVNGKPFFDKDGKIALQNLPAEIIDKVQVTDTKTKEEEFSGQAASGNNSSINLTIQEDKNKGLFGKFMGGYGSDKRYESSAMLNYFKGDRKISVLASSNNINSSGFSMNEIFDSMSGGRNRTMSMSSNGSFSINGVQFGGAQGTGITRSNLAGVNYSDALVKGFDSNVSYFYNGFRTENDNRTQQTTLLPQNENVTDTGNLNTEYTTFSESRTKSDSYSHNINSEFDIMIDSTAQLNINPRFMWSNNKYKATSSQRAINGNNVLLNESNASNRNETDNHSFVNTLTFFKAFRSKKGRSLSVSLDNNIQKNKADNLNQSATFFYNDTNNDGIPETSSDIRNQVLYQHNYTDQLGISIEYLEPVLDSLRLKIGNGYTINNTVNNRKVFDFDAATGLYSIANGALTQYLSQQQDRIVPYVGLSLEKEKFNLSLETGTTVVSLQNYASYLGTDYAINRQYILPYANLYTSLRFTNSQYLYFNYAYQIEFPTAAQLLPVEDLSNPLATSIGNPELKPNKSHDIYMGFSNYNYSTNSGWNIYGGGTYYESQIVANTTIDQSAKSTTTYTNIAGNFNNWVGGAWNKTIKSEAHSYRFTLGLSSGYAYAKGFTNGVIFKAREVSLSPKIGFRYNYGDLLSLNPSYKFEYSEQNYTNYTLGRASNVVHGLSLETTSYWPKHVVIGNDINYTYNSNIADGFRKDFLLWNTSVGYNFLKDKLLFKVKVYDLLNQNLSATRTINPTGILDQQNTVLRRYVMFSLTYKLQKFGAKENKDDDEGGGFWFW
ncbi:hypothetical protein CHU92_02430 [Flavobacterium cyanobacteriorum]|uniref:Outer membrane protein beta-barrel domain-containing protein n=1 Tax=Flavobacterium cyanobacteriorum TaxID=2022802 RepID=A0A255ZSP2_9FLAO|nr:outer membrane beta-barrel protein [Flavobacterium cyanobacteriorum]OYQ44412.1 hypothetical protein CHU92_02430 [Flavobacterium cyanobacteriorum]